MKNHRPVSELKYNNAWIGRTWYTSVGIRVALDRRWSASDRSIDPPTSSLRKQVSPRKTELIRKILIFIHIRGDAGRWWHRRCWPTGRKSVLKIPGGTKSGWQDYPFL